MECPLSGGGYHLEFLFTKISLLELLDAVQVGDLLLFTNL